MDQQINGRRPQYQRQFDPGRRKLEIQVLDTLQNVAKKLEAEKERARTNRQEKFSGPSSTLREFKQIPEEKNRPRGRTTSHSNATQIQCGLRNLGSSTRNVRDTESEDEQERRSPREGKKNGYTKSYKKLPLRESEVKSKSELLKKLTQLNKLLEDEEENLGKDQVVACISQLEDYLNQERNYIDAVPSTQEAENAAAKNFTNRLYNCSPPRGLRNTDMGVTDIESRPAGPLENLSRHAQSSAEQRSSIHRNAVRCNLRSHGDGEVEPPKAWDQSHWQKEMQGRLPFIDPEVKMIFQLKKDIREQLFAENEEYIKGLEYHPADLDLITIKTLPSNGDKKPAHSGPQGEDYYKRYSERLFASINTWIEKYFTARDDSSFELPFLDGKSYIAFVSKSSYFDGGTFGLASPAASGEGETKHKERRERRLAFLKFIFFNVLHHEIFSHWVYGCDPSVSEVIREWSGIAKENETSELRYQARGIWFRNNIRRENTNMTAKIIEHQIAIAGTLRKLLGHFSQYSTFAHEDAAKKILCTTAERELHMIIADAQALQMMFQSEYSRHKIFVHVIGTKHSPENMMDCSDPALMKSIGREAIAGNVNPLGDKPEVAMSIEPGLMIRDQIVMQEKVVLQPVSKNSKRKLVTL